MARYIAIIQGSRGEASRLGTPSSGIRAHVRGWNRGVTVYGDPRTSDKTQDAFTVHVDGGSNDPSSRRELVTIHEDGTLSGGIVEELRSLAYETDSEGFPLPAHVKLARVQIALDKLTGKPDKDAALRGLFLADAGYGEER